MADPLSIAASIGGAVSAGIRIATGLNAIVDTVKNAPKELSYMAQQIEHLSELLGCTFQVIEENETLYRDRLTLILRDVRWQFKIIQDVVEKCLSGGKARRRLRFLFKAKLVDGLMRKLEALKKTMTLTLQITQLAEREVRKSRIKDQQIASLHNSAVTTVKRGRQALKRLVDSEETPDLVDEDHLVKYNERPLDMAQWMAVSLSATSVEMSESATPSSSGAIETAASFPQNLLNIPRALPKHHLSEQVEFRSAEIDVRALERYDMAWKKEFVGFRVRITWK